MSLYNTFREVAIARARKQTKVIDKLTEDAPALATLPMAPSTHGLMNVYEEILSATGPQIVDLDTALGTIDASSELKQISLSAIGGIIEVGEDKARQFGGPRQYTAAKMPAILRRAGMDIEASMFYNNFRAYAAANSKLVDVGGTDSYNYTILCSKFVEGENTGLYDPAGLGNGKAFDFEWLCNGGLYKNSSSILVYGLRMKTYFGLQLANYLNIAGLVNVDLRADDSTPTGYKKLPTIKQMDDLIANARGTQTNTVLWCHPKVITALGIYKPLQMNVLDTNLNMTIATWNGVPMISSYNWYDGTETKVTV
jgi:hypothetical protein